jgi:hypothetical protein
MVGADHRSNDRWRADPAAYRMRMHQGADRRHDVIALPLEAQRRRLI